MALGPLQELKKELKEVDHAPTGLAQPVGSASPDDLGSKVSEMGNGGGDHETGQGEMTQSPSPPATPTFEIPEFQIIIKILVVPLMMKPEMVGTMKLQTFIFSSSLNLILRLRKVFRPQREHPGSLR